MEADEDALLEEFEASMRGPALKIVRKDQPAPLGWPEPLDLEALAEREPALPQFVVQDWLPCGYATLLAGHGGVGKSSIALYLGVCIAAGVPFFGLLVERRRVLYLSCEDRENVLHWRLVRICKYTGTDLASLRGWLEVLDLVGYSSVLWERDRLTGAALSAAYGCLQVRMQTQQTQVLVLDGVSDTFGGNENARTDVKHFVNVLLSLIPAEDGALLLLGHVPKPTATGVTTSEGYSGSTGWHNAVRARWYLFPETQPGEDGERAERTGKLTLELQKSNLGRTDQSMRFAWDEDAHLFIGETTAASAFDRKHRDTIERDGILRALKVCATSIPPVVVPAAMQGPHTAYHVLSIRPEFPASLRTGKHRFRRHIEALRQIHAIEEVEYRRANRHVTAKLALTTEGLRQCAAL